MKLKIISQTKKLFEGEVEEVYAPTTTGIIGVLPSHSNLVSMLEVGMLRVKLSGGEVKRIPLNGGLIRVSDDNVTVLAQEAALPEEILEKEIDQAIKNAEEKIASKLAPTELIQLEKQLRYERLKKKAKVQR